MCWTKPSLTSHLSEIPNHASSVSVSKDSTKLYSDRTNIARCCGTKFVHSLIMRLVRSGGMARFRDPGLARQSSPLSPLSQPMSTCERMMQTMGGLFSLMIREHPIHRGGRLILL